MTESTPLDDDRPAIFRPPAPATIPEAPTPVPAAETADVAAIAAASASVPASVPADGGAPPPRTRWAAIVWGVFFAALATLGLWVQTDGSRRDGLARWFVTAEPPALIAVLLLAVGLVALVSGIAGMLRRIQRRGTTAR